MSLIQDMKKHKNLTEREQDIRKYILEHPEKIEEMSSRELGHATFASAASVTRFCQKLGTKGFCSWSGNYNMKRLRKKKS